MQDGTIVLVNRSRAMFVVSIDDGDYAVFEYPESIELAEGDRLRGDLEALGGETFTHLDQRRRFDVYGQSGPSSLAACKKILGM